jgi:hypothetical protein
VVSEAVVVVEKKQKAGNYNHDNGHDNDAAPRAVTPAQRVAGPWSGFFSVNSLKKTMEG